MEALGISWGSLVAQLFNVIILIWLLSLLLYKPVLNALNERTRRIQESLREADQVKEQIARAKQDYDAEIAKARQESAVIVAQAQERAKTQEAEILNQARQEAARIREDASKQIDQERTRLLGELKKDMAELVTATATKVLGAELKGNHDRLIEESLSTFGRQN